METHHYLFLLALSFAACSRHDSMLQPSSSTITYKDTSAALPFIANNRLIFFQNFGFDTTFHVSGYYQLDLNTKTTTLLHCYSTPYVMEEFQLDPHAMISVRQDAVYRVTMP